MLIDIKEHKKNYKLKNMSEAIRHILVLKMGWVGSKYQLESPSGKVGTNGIDFWKMVKDNAWPTRKSLPIYLMPVNKAQKIELDTDAGLLIFDDIVAIDVK